MSIKRCFKVYNAICWWLLSDEKCYLKICAFLQSIETNHDNFALIHGMSCFTGSVPTDNWT